jgi:hypothetical protein
VEDPKPSPWAMAAIVALIVMVALGVVRGCAAWEHATHAPHVEEKH